MGEVLEVAGNRGDWVLVGAMEGVGDFGVMEGVGDFGAMEGVGDFGALLSARTHSIAVDIVAVVVGGLGVVWGVRPDRGRAAPRIPALQIRALPRTVQHPRFPGAPGWAKECIDRVHGCMGCMHFIRSHVARMQ